MDTWREACSKVVYFTIVVPFLQVARGEEAMEAKKDAHIWDFKSLMFENHNIQP